MLVITYVAYTTILVLYKIEPYPTYKYIEWPPWCVQLRNYKAMPTQSPLKQPPYNLPTPHCLTPHGDTPLLTCTILTGTLEYIYSTTLTLRPPSPHRDTRRNLPVHKSTPNRDTHLQRCIHPRAYRTPTQLGTLMHLGQ